MIQEAKRLVCDQCGKKSEGDRGRLDPTVIPEENKGWLSINLNPSNAQPNYKDYCSTECLKKEIDRTFNETT